MIGELSCALPPGPRFAELAELAEELGYSRVWIFDSAPLWEDPFIHLALAAERTDRIGLGTAVLIPGERSVMAMASSIATVARLAPGRVRACFGTGFTSMAMIGQRPMTVDAMIDYVGAVRALLSGDTAIVDGAATRMMHWPGLAAERPIDVEVWLSVFGPRGNRRAVEVAEGVIGPPHASLPSATMVSGTVLDPVESADADRVLEAVGPWRVLGWHSTYARAGAVGVDALEGGERWRGELEELWPEGERHLATFEGHVTHMPDRDRRLLENGPVGGAARGELIGEVDAVRAGLESMFAAGFAEVIYTPSGPDVARELRTFATAGPPTKESPR